MNKTMVKNQNVDQKSTVQNERKGEKMGADSDRGYKFK